MIPFFTWQCTGWVQGDNTKIILSGLAFCRNHQVNFGGIEQYARAQIKWNGGFSSLLETLFLAWPSTQRGGSLLEEKTSGNVTCGQGCPAPSLHRLDFPLQLSERKEPERFWFWSYFRIITAENIQTAWWLRDFSGFPWSAPEIKAVNTCSSGMITSCWFLLINILITICTFWQFWTQADGDDSRRLQRWFTGRSWPSEATPSLRQAGFSPTPGHLAAFRSRCADGCRCGTADRERLAAFPSEALLSKTRAPKAELLAAVCRCDWPLNSKLLWGPGLGAGIWQSRDLPVPGLLESAQPLCHRRQHLLGKKCYSCFMDVLISQLK